MNDVNNYTTHPSAFCSTANVEGGAINIVGTTSAIISINTTDNRSISVVEQTLNNLRKAIVANFIKKPKTFKGGKYDVNKWIEVMLWSGLKLVDRR